MWFHNCHMALTKKRCHRVHASRGLEPQSSLQSCTASKRKTHFKKDQVHIEKLDQKTSFKRMQGIYGPRIPLKTSTELKNLTLYLMAISSIENEAHMFLQ